MNLPKQILALPALLMVCLAACSSSEADIAAPRNQLFFPAGMAVDPTGDWLYVASSNADLKYSGGTVGVVDLREVDRIIASQQTPRALPPQEDKCVPSVLSPGALLCDEKDTKLYVKAATVRIGSFAGDLKLQELDSKHRRLFTAVRGDPSVSFVDVELPTGAAPILTCTKDHASATTGLATLCDDNYRLTSVYQALDINGNALTLPAEPFGVTLDPVLALGYVTHLSTGHVTLLDIRPELDAPRAIDFRAGFFTANSAGDLTAFAAVPRTPGDPNGFVYLTSRTAGRVATFRVSGATPPPANQIRTGTRLLPGPSFDLPSQFVTASGADIRGAAFSHGGDRAYLLSRTPASLLVLDSSIDPVTAMPKNTLLDQIPVCAQPSLLAMRELTGGTRAYVVCFAAGQVWAIDPAAARVLRVINSGRGPNAIAIREGANPRLYIANFAEDTISVIDLAPGPTEHQLLLKIGIPLGSG